MARLINKVMNYVLASARDSSGNPFCPLRESSMGKKIVADSPVELWGKCDGAKGRTFTITFVKNFGGYDGQTKNHKS